MNDFFKLLFDFIFIKTKKNSHKILYGLIIITVLLLVNNYLGITKNLLVNRRLNQLEQLKRLDPETFSRDSIIQSEIRNIKLIIFEKTTFIDKTTNFISGLFQGILTWKNFSACVFVLLSMVALPLAILFDKNLKKPLWPTIGILLIAELILFTTAIIFIKVLGMIPDFKYPWLNYFLNYILQFLIIFLVIILIPSKKDSK